MFNMSGLLNSLITFSNNILIGGIWDDIKEFFIKLALSIVYRILTLVSSLLDVIFDLSRIDLFSGEQIGEIANRVYIILGVVMLFKIIISCIQYLINPDKSEDKEAGFGAIFKRVIFTLALLALVPEIFSFAKTAQLSISEALPRVILGISDDSNYRDKVSNKLIYSTMLSFFEVNDDCCTGSNYDSCVESQISTFKSRYPTAKAIYKAQDAIFKATCSGKTKTYGFSWLLGIAVSGFLVFIVASMSLDVAIRLLKFGFLELVAPIPIASYIDPKSSKKMFDSWVKTSVSVYLDLFIRLGAIYLVVFLFETLYNSNLFAGQFKIDDVYIGVGRTWLLRVFVIIGLFMFAKDFPKFLSDALGLKEAGDIGKMFKRAGGIAGAGLGGLKTARSNYTTQKERLLSQNKKAARLRAALSAAAGAGSASARGLKMSTMDGKGFKDVRTNAFKNATAARDKRIDLHDNILNYSHDEDRYTYKDYLNDRNRARLGIPSNDQFVKARYDSLDQASRDIGSAKSHGATKMNETPDRYKIKLKASDVNQSVIISTLGYDEMSMEEVRNLYQVARNNGGKVKNKSGVEITLSNDQLAALGQTVQDIEKRTSYMKEAELAATSDPAALTSLNKIINNLKVNSAGYNAKEVFSTISKVMDDAGFAGINNTTDLINLLNGLKSMNHTEPKRSDFASDADFAAAKSEWLSEVNKKADILQAAKKALEDATTANFNAAELASMRIKKAEQATKNDKK